MRRLRPDAGGAAATSSLGERFFLKAGFDRRVAPVLGGCRVLPVRGPRPSSEAPSRLSIDLAAKRYRYFTSAVVRAR